MFLRQGRAGFVWFQHQELVAQEALPARPMVLNIPYSCARVCVF